MHKTLVKKIQFLSCKKYIFGVKYKIVIMPKRAIELQKLRIKNLEYLE